MRCLSAAVLLLPLAALLAGGQETPTDIPVEPAAEPPAAAGDGVDISADNATDHELAEHDHVAENGTEPEHDEHDDWTYRAENATEMTINATELADNFTTELAGNFTTEPAGNFTTELPGNFTTELPGNVTGPAGNSSDSTLSCFVCNTATEPVCDDPFSAAAAEAAGLLQDCPSVSGLRTVCRKTWQMVPGDTRVVRSCGHDNDPRTCFVTAEAVTASHVCHCYQDACNEAPAARAAAAGLLLAAVAVIGALC